jgi:type VI protein secretion system component VasK
MFLCHGREEMKVLLIISMLLFLVLALFSALLWMGGVAGVVTGGGRGTDGLDYLLTLSAVFLGLACFSGVTAWALPVRKKWTDSN